MGTEDGEQSVEMVLPPTIETEHGRRRMIGVELEFAGISCEQAAEVVRDLFGGCVNQCDAYRYEVAETRFGAFTVELDAQFAHPSDDEASDQSTLDGIGRRVRNGLKSAYGAIAGLWLPVEIVSPPVAISDLPELDTLIPTLRRLGAEDTRDGLIYAFATQFNPEVPSLCADSVLAHLKAFLLLADTLRSAIDVDPLRQALPFTDPFPADYVHRVIDPGYWPEMPQLIEDYLDANPTRNRELDLLPLLAHIAPESVRQRITDTLIKARPTFHYRLPDTRLSEEAWSLVVEWNRWADVEHLAADRATLERLGQDCLENTRRNGTGHNGRPRPRPDLINAWRIERASGH